MPLSISLCRIPPFSKKVMQRKNLAHFVLSWQMNGESPVSSMVYALWKSSVDMLRVQQWFGLKYILLPWITHFSVFVSICQRIYNEFFVVLAHSKGAVLHPTNLQNYFSSLTMRITEPFTQVNQAHEDSCRCSAS